MERELSDAATSSAIGRRSDDEENSGYVHSGQLPQFCIDCRRFSAAGKIQQRVQRAVTRAALVQPYVERRMKDVAYYLESRELRERICERIMQTAQQHDRVLVIGHSLGSLAAVQALAWTDLCYRTNAVVLCGSPLPLLPLQQKMDPGALDFVRRERPPLPMLSVADPRDLVTGGRDL